jgi:hypothetical protein
MKSDKVSFTLLTGGLGNQLFQYAFMISRGKEINTLISTWGKPRLNSNREPEISSFILDPSCNVKKPRMDGLLIRKSIGYVLRSGFAPKIWEKGLIRILASSLATLEVSFHLSRFLFVRGHRALGYIKIKKSRLNYFEIGYFQSYRWAAEPEVFGKLMKLELHQNDRIKKYKTLADFDEPVVMHFRFGDYLAEAHFGIPSAEYYTEAITAISKESFEARMYWIFSDDMQKAREVIARIGIEKATFFSSEDFSTSETLEIMRLGHDYVIANSTFSWWAAFLRHNRTGLVVAPSPWFKSLPVPEDLIPPEWIQKSAHF